MAVVSVEGPGGGLTLPPSAGVEETGNFAVGEAIRAYLRMQRLNHVDRRQAEDLIHSLEGLSESPYADAAQPALEALRLCHAVDQSVLEDDHRGLFEERSRAATTALEALYDRMFPQAAVEVQA